MSTFASVVARLDAHTRPALTYTGDEPRIELGGPTLARWASKISGYLLSDLDLRPRGRVCVRLGNHWRTLAWGLGVLQAGGILDIGADSDLAAADIAVCATEEDLACARDAGVGDVVAQVRDSLALAWPGEVPEGCDDAQAAVMGHPDVLAVPGHPWSTTATPIVGAEASVSDLTTPLVSLTPGEHVAWASLGAREDCVRALRVWASGAHAIIVPGPLTEDALRSEHARPFEA